MEDLLLDDILYRLRKNLCRVRCLCVVIYLKHTLLIWLIVAGTRVSTDLFALICSCGIQIVCGTTCVRCCICRLHALSLRVDVPERARIAPTVSPLSSQQRCSLSRGHLVAQAKPGLRCVSRQERCRSCNLWEIASKDAPMRKRVIYNVAGQHSLDCNTSGRAICIEARRSQIMQNAKERLQISVKSASTEFDMTTKQTRKSQVYTPDQDIQKLNSHGRQERYIQAET